MADAVVSKSKILAGLKKKSKGAYARAKETEAKAKGIWEPPGGLQDVTAQLVSWKLGEDKNHNAYFSLKAIIREGKYKGKVIFVSHFISETKTKTVEQKLMQLCSDIKLLGGDLEEAEDVDAMCAVLDTLCEEVKPYFFFNTWKPTEGFNGQPARVQIFIQGLNEEFEPDEDDEPEAEEEEKPEEEEGSEDDTDTEAETDEEEAFLPVKGDIFKYKSAPRTKAQECTVTAVNKAKETVSLKRISDDKLFKDVGWDKLESA